MSGIDERTKTIRTLAVRNAVASSRLEGGRPSAYTLYSLQLYTEGKVTIDSLVADVKRRYGRA